MSNFTATAIERIATGSVIFIRDGFNAAAEVMTIDFEGDSYAITYGNDDWSDVTTIRCGETVEAFNGQTFIRADSDITDEEWRAKKDAIMAATDALLGEANRVRGHKCQSIDESLLTASVAAAIGVPGLQAAE